jgi:hypothetical protein
MLNTFRRINFTNVDWFSLRNVKIKDRVLHLYKCNYILNIEKRYYPHFLAESLFVDKSDEIFTRKYINKEIFPNVKNLYFLSDPGESDILWRNFDNIYLLDKYKSLYDECLYSDHIRICTYNDFKKVIRDELDKCDAFYENLQKPDDYDRFNE